jgi:hypothetical protein
MAKPFHEAWEAMEARRRQVDAGEVPPAFRCEHAHGADRRSEGCPDEEALCGWVDGQLCRSNLRRWLRVWLHIRIRCCRNCLADIEALAHAMPPAAKAESHDRTSRG